MICPYCEIEIHLPQINKQQFTSSYYCNSCRDEFIVWESIKPGDYAVQWQKYRIYCDNKNNCAQLQRIYMDIESDTSIMWRWYNVLELPSIPQNLNEETIEQKIKMYLLFS